ncbi:hypothetical protein [Micromonospora palythoicola]|uniref:hypothetical protein n=1 Tax=Micromonospora palythoicola TaxID=3120507 RepID=UPI002FCE26D9
MSSVDARQEVPEKVASLAAERGLGTLIDKRSSGNPIRSALTIVAVGTVAVVVSVALFALASSWRPLIWLAIPSLALGICAVGWFVVVLVRGFEAGYLYPGGMVYVRNGNARAATWAEMAEVEVQVFGGGTLFAGKTAAYVMKPTGQSPMRVNSTEVGLKDGEQDPVGAVILRLASEAGRPITQKLVGKK